MGRGHVDGVHLRAASRELVVEYGDVITHLGNQAISTPIQLSKALETALASPGDNLIPLQVIRGTQTRIVFLERYWLNADATESP